MKRKNPLSSTAKRVSHALAAFIKRPQAEYQIGAVKVSAYDNSKSMMSLKALQ
jgi:hypothetical protein